MQCFPTLTLLLITTGELPDIADATHGEINVDETGEVKFESNKWNGRIVEQNENSVEMEVHIPANCAIGEWSFCVDTRTLVDGKKTKTFRYEHPDNFIILLNPWCKGNRSFQ